MVFTACYVEMQFTSFHQQQVFRGQLTKQTVICSMHSLCRRLRLHRDFAVHYGRIGCLFKKTNCHLEEMMPKAERKRHARSHERRIRLHFLGAAKMVTGSLHFFEVSEGDKTVRFFIDAGLNQENDSVNFQNRLPHGLKAADIDFGVFTHAHIDHTGFFPRLVKEGFKGHVYTTAATRDLVGLLLPDSGHLQEEEAQRANARAARRAKEQGPEKQAGKQKPRGKNQKHAGVQPQKSDAGVQVNAGATAPARVVQPLYTQEEAEKALFHIKTVEFDSPFEVRPGIVLRFTTASHLLGAAVVTVEIGTGSKKRRIVFTGDLGRPHMPVLQELAPLALADYIICEGTYGNKLHAQRDRLEALEQHVKGALERAAKPQGKRSAKSGAGVVIMAAFAVGRVQSLLHDLRLLMDSGRLPDTPVFVDGRMANNANEVYRNHSKLYNKGAAKRLSESANGRDLFSPPRFMEVREWSQSLALDNPAAEPAIIITSSGMASGGRVLRHLENRLPHEQNTILFCGYQSVGTLGRQLVSPGVQTVRVNGKEIAVRATVEHMEDYSGHADYEDILRWLRGFQTRPDKVFLVHGEPESLDALKKRIEDRLRWDVEVPQVRDHVDIE
jgi:metallo-beta-lactamase family protein